MFNVGLVSDTFHLFASVASLGGGEAVGSFTLVMVKDR